MFRRETSLSHRIRLLPRALTDSALLPLLRHCDLVLDSFPIGSHTHLLSLALSAGTPVVTLVTGTILSTGREDLQEAKHNLHYHKELHKHPLRAYMLAHNSLPWIPSTSGVAGYYRTVGLESFLVANSTATYFQLAQDILGDRELAYKLRIKLLDTIDNTGTSANTIRDVGRCPGDDLAR
jgi:hypothetical protein